MLHLFISGSPEADFSILQKNLAILNKRAKGGCSCLCMLISVVGIVVLVVAIYMILKYL
ncbi:hypothetical protein HanLR1_Chr05g0186931 [Helianthus annuus]|nr:hypothetical protein HanLR1_Chr05g0186931 [Helianthus annuus]